MSSAYFFFLPVDALFESVRSIVAEADPNQIQNLNVEKSLSRKLYSMFEPFIY